MRLRPRPLLCAKSGAFCSNSARSSVRDARELLRLTALCAALRLGRATRATYRRPENGRERACRYGRGVVAIPVKSMLGEELDAADLSQRGVVGDRAYALRDKQS